jgi:Na+-driven multidrug efflux pump
MCAAAVWVAYARHPFKKYRVLGRFWRPDWPLLRRLLAVGIPISGAFLLGFGLFAAAAALLLGRIGATALAAHAIALQAAAILVMVPFGISLAATVRVGQACWALKDDEVSQHLYAPSWGKSHNLSLPCWTGLAAAGRCGLSHGVCASLTGCAVMRTAL